MQIWRDIGVGLKIVLSFSVIVLLLLAIGAAGYLASTDIQHTVEDLFESKLPGIDYLVEADRDLQQALVAERTMFFVEPGSDVFKAMQDDYVTNVGQVVTRAGKFFELFPDAETAAQKEKFNKAMAVWKPLSEAVIAARANGESPDLVIAKELGEASVAFEGMREILNQLTEKVLAEAEVNHQASTEKYSLLTIVLISGTLGSFFLACLFAFILTRSITGPINKGVALAEDIRLGDTSKRLRMTQRDEMGRLATALDAMADVLERRAKLANAIASGDMDQEVVLASDKDSLGKALLTMVGNMNEALSEVKDASDQIAAGAAQVNDASTSLSQGSTEQAAAIEEINSSMTVIGGQTRTNAESAANANQMMEKVVTVVGSGKEAGQAMAASMDEISTASAQVAKINKVIDEIAFQTNLLALNAAVEAARAGRHGKGFAVVAEEVRNLAGRSAKAAQETTELIQSALAKVEVGMGLTQRLDESFEEIVSSATGVAGIIAEIATSSNEQAQGVAQVNQGINQVDTVTQQNTANAEETASAATVLSEQASQLQQTLTRFRLREGEGRSFSARQAQPQALPPMEENDWDSMGGETDFAKY